jgi:hypothetical protein
LLVPSAGPASTVQGEVIRISGRVAHTVLDSCAYGAGQRRRQLGRRVPTDGCSFPRVPGQRPARVCGRPPRGPRDRKGHPTARQ